MDSAPTNIDRELFVWFCRFHDIKGADEFATWLDEFAEPFPKEEMTSMRASTVQAIRQGDEPRAFELAQHTIARWTVHVLRPLARTGRAAKKAHSASASAPRKVTPQMAAAILRTYNRRVAAGDKYGAIKAIASEFEVSRTTASDVIHGKKNGK